MTTLTQRMNVVEENLQSIRLTLDTLLQNLLNPALMVPGTLRFGGNIMQLDQNGIQITADDAGGVGAILFRETLTPKPGDATTGSNITGIASTSGNDIGQAQLEAFVADGGTGQVAVKAETGVSTVEVALDSSSTVGDAFFSITHSDQGRLLAWNGAINLAGDSDSGVLTPAQFTANQNNYGPTNGISTTLWRLTSDASRDLTGIQPGLADLKFLFNVGAFDIVLKDESANSDAQNRFALKADITLAPEGAALIWYDPTSSRWRCVGTY